jgi:hypothetical protein
MFKRKFFNVLATAQTLVITAEKQLRGFLQRQKTNPMHSQLEFGNL